MMMMGGGGGWERGVRGLGSVWFVVVVVVVMAVVVVVGHTLVRGVHGSFEHHIEIAVVVLIGGSIDTSHCIIIITIIISNKT